ETSDYDLAAKVILHGRENQWGQFLTLGTTMYRLGIIQPLLTAIEGIIDKVEYPRYRSELNNILGDLYWTTGKVYRAISCQQKAIAISQNCLQSISATPDSEHELYYWRMLEVDSLLSWGLYNIDLWELAAAADLFKQVIDLASHTKHHSWSEKASLGLALVRSHLIGFDSSNAIVEHLYHQIIELENEAYNTGRFAYFMQILGQILFNYQRIASAKAVWQKTILFSQEGNFTQIKAKSLTGLGNVERHRNNLEEAEYYHHQAIESLEKIDAKCDLAEAYFQLGITLKQKKQANKSIYFLRRAVKLFRQIEAPKQVERVETVLNEMIASS
ncbi:MAG: tetratricopeptide repeat protein, partial [Cyanobacteria bacterium P01_G01_bin.19]